MFSSCFARREYLINTRLGGRESAQFLVATLHCDDIADVAQHDRADHGSGDVHFYCPFFLEDFVSMNTVIGRMVRCP